MDGTFFFFQRLHLPAELFSQEGDVARGTFLELERLGHREAESGEEVERLFMWRVLLTPKGPNTSSEGT